MSTSWRLRGFELNISFRLATYHFFSLGYGARLLAPIFRRPSAWRVLHALIAVLMTVIAIGLLRGG